MSLDLLGHAGYFLFGAGMICLASRLWQGWLLRMAGGLIWAWIGVQLEMTSIWAWSSVFLVLDLTGLWRWSRSTKSRSRDTERGS